MRRLVGIALVCYGCVESAVVPCGDGSVCPAGTTCDVAHGCTTPAQIAACSSATSGDTCTYAVPDDGVCDDSVCVPSRCGDGYLRAGEECDGEAFGALTDCMQLGFYDSKPVGCKTNCTLDDTMCTGFCGDQVVQDGELCEAPNAPPLSCVDLGYGAGFLECSQCGPGLTDCKLVGWQTYYFSKSLVDVHGTSDSDVWVVGSGTASHFDGTAWRDPDLSACGTVATSFSAVWTFGADTFLGSSSINGGKVIHLSASGCTTSTLTVGSSQIDDLWGTSPTDVFAATYTGTFHFNGTTWTLLDAEPSHQIWGSGPNDVYIVAGAPAKLAHYNGTWSLIASATMGISSYVATVWGSAANDVYVAGDPELVHWNGSSWQSAAQGVPPIGFVVAGSIVGPVTFVRGIDDIVVRLGADWVALQAPQFETSPKPMWASPSGALYAIDGPHLNVFTGNTRSTELVQAGLSGADHIVVRGANDAFALRQKSVYVWDGATWNNDNESSAITFEDIVKVTDGTMFAVNTSGIWRRTAADSWTPVNNSVGGKQLWGTSATDLWVLEDDRSTLHHWTGTDTTYTFDIAYIGGVYAKGTNDTYVAHAVFTGSGGNVIEHWNGSTFTPAYMTASYLEGLWGIGNHVYAVAPSDAAVVHFDGTTWTEAPSLVGVAPTMIWGTGPSDLFIGGSRLAHYDGTRWSPVATGDASLSTLDIDGSATALFHVDLAGVHRLVRTRPW